MSFYLEKLRIQGHRKKNLIHELIEGMMKLYVQPELTNKYEWIEDPKTVKESIDFAHSNIGFLLSAADHQLVHDILIRRQKRITNKNLFLLHGDCGMHNFLFEKGSLSGVIDPLPVLGRPLYDLLYAFCSSPDDLEFPILLKSSENLRVKDLQESELIEDLIVALYLRLSTCLQHHPVDFPEYLNSWNRWIHLGGKR